MQGTIFDIQRFSIHDGPGIRTTVFLKGCPLRCKWCHNPESQSFKPERLIYFDKCAGCGKCAAICEKAFDNECDACGKCAAICEHGVREIAGRTVTVDHVIETVKRDKAFYETSGGGMTLSGGEPLSQPGFCFSLLQKARDENIKTAVETCGFVKTDIIEKLIPATDLIIFDLKGIDEKNHISNTGASNRLILENAKLIMRSNCDVLFRMPYIPGLNAGEVCDVRAFTEGFPLELMPYHNTASGKYKALQRRYATEKLQPPDPDEMRRAADETGAIYSPSGI